MQARRTRAELESLDERSLADLQISRCDFDRIASGAYRRQAAPDDPPRLPAARGFGKLT